MLRMHLRAAAALLHPQRCALSRMCPLPCSQALLEQHKQEEEARAQFGAGQIMLEKDAGPAADAAAADEDAAGGDEAAMDVEETGGGEEAAAAGDAADAAAGGEDEVDEDEEAVQEDEELEEAAGGAGAVPLSATQEQIIKLKANCLTLGMGIEFGRALIAAMAQVRGAPVWGSMAQHGTAWHSMAQHGTA